MPQESVEVVRKPLRVRDTSSRAFDQRLFLLLPRLNAASARLLDRLPPSSRLRQAMLWRAVRMGCEALNRRDLDAMLLNYHPACEIHPAREWVEAGLMERRYRGREGYREFVASWSDVWGADWRVEPVELIDLGERIVLLVHQPVRGQASGAPVDQEVGVVWARKDGLIVRQQEYFGYTEALEAVGLEE